MEGKKIKELLQEANLLKDNLQYRESARKYKQLVDYVKNNNLKFDEKDEAVCIAGISECYRNADCDKFIGSQNAKNIINGFLRRNPNVNIKKYDVIRKEIIWSYIEYYFSEKYENTSNKIKVATKVISIIKKNEIKEYKTITFYVAEKLLKDFIVEEYPQEIYNLLKFYPYGEEYFKDIDFPKNTESKYPSMGLSNNYSTSKNELKNEEKIIKKIIVYKFRALYYLNEFDKIIRARNNVFNCGDIKKLSVTVERIVAKSYVALERYDDAIDVLESAQAEFGYNLPYLHRDLADVKVKKLEINSKVNFYEKEIIFDSIILNYYKFLYSKRRTLDRESISKTLLDVAKILFESKHLLETRKHLTLYMLIQNKNNKEICKDALDLDKKIIDKANNINDKIKKIYQFNPNADYEKIQEELISMWEYKINKEDGSELGKVYKISDDRKYGYLNKDESSEKYYFKIREKEHYYKLKEGDYVKFDIVRGYEQDKNEYRKEALLVEICDKDEILYQKAIEEDLERRYLEAEKKNYDSWSSGYSSGSHMILDELGLDEEHLGNLENLFES